MEGQWIMANKMSCDNYEKEFSFMCQMFSKWEEIMVLNGRLWGIKCVLNRSCFTNGSFDRRNHGMGSVFERIMLEKSC